MTNLIKGLHHVTSLAGDAPQNNAFFTETLGLRRIKKTVNFDNPKVYHLYYGDRTGNAGTVMTYFPFPGMKRGARGTGEVSSVSFSVPAGTLEFWSERLAAAGTSGIKTVDQFGQTCLCFQAPDTDAFHLVETPSDERIPWASAGITAENAIRGFHSVRLHVADAGPTGELLELMGYRKAGQEGGVHRYSISGGNPANIIDLEEDPEAPDAEQGAGSVHHIAFAVEDAEAQQSVRDMLIAEGHRVTEVRDRDYFLAIYFRSPGGILFEVATHGPGFDRDESVETLGTALKLPSQHAHLREELERTLQPLN